MRRMPYGLQLVLPVVATVFRDRGRIRAMHRRNDYVVRALRMLVMKRRCCLLRHHHESGYELDRDRVRSNGCDVDNIRFRENAIGSEELRRFGSSIVGQNHKEWAITLWRPQAD